MKILVIDDDPFALKLLGRQLTELGCDDLTLCNDAREALALLGGAEHGVDLVFCDLQMPHLDGIAFVRHLADIGYAGGLVLVSGEDSRLLQSVHKLALAYRIQILGALRKPVAAGQLQQMLEGSGWRRFAPSKSPARWYGVDELERGIAAGELVNHYQPKVDLRTAELLGVESLVRWVHPQAGLVYPDAFIGTAEEHGLIDKLTHAVLAGALNQARAWLQQGLTLQVAVNVSMDNLLDLDFPDTVARMAERAGVPCARLTLEVTESRLMSNPRAVLEVLNRLYLRGITLSIDDFGTGHSSLAHLRDVPFRELKIDRGFVNGISSDDALRAIAESTLAMARQLDIKCVAEGVEDVADWTALQRLGGDAAQGYLVAKPMSGDELLRWCEGWDLRRVSLIAA